MRFSRRRMLVSLGALTAGAIASCCNPTNGFIISPAYLPGAFDEFVDLVVPELQKRPLFRREYTGNTLRDSLGLN